MKSGNRIVLGLAAVTVITALGCQSVEPTVTWQEDGVPYFTYADSTRNHYSFVYHPNDQVYYQPYTEKYYWYENHTWWQGSRDELPRQLALDGRPINVVGVASRFPFMNHETVVAMHPPLKEMPAGFDGREQVLTVVQFNDDDNGNDTAGVTGDELGHEMVVEVVDHPVLMDEASIPGAMFAFESMNDGTVAATRNETKVAVHAGDEDSSDEMSPVNETFAEVGDDENMSDPYADEQWTDENTSMILFDDFWVYFPEQLYRQFERLHRPVGSPAPAANTVGAAAATATTTTASSRRAESHRAAAMTTSTTPVSANAPASLVSNEMFPITPADSSMIATATPSIPVGAVSPDGTMVPFTPIDPAAFGLAAAHVEESPYSADGSMIPIEPVRTASQPARENEERVHVVEAAGDEPADD